MQSWKKILIVSIAALLMVSTVAPAFAAESAASTAVPVTIQNKTGEAVTVTFKGPDNVTVSVPKARNVEKKLEPGSYTYKYTACGKKFTGTLSVFAPAVTLRLPKCGNPEEATVVIDNRTGTPFRLLLSGKKNYSLWIGSGITKLTIVAGGYKYSAFVCGDTQIGILKAKAGRINTQTWVWDCD